MEFKEAFELMKKGNSCWIEGTKYKLVSECPPRLERREIGREDCYPVETLGYFIYSLASDLWKVSDEDN